MGTSEDKELQEIEILTPEQIEVLPDDVKKNVLVLTDNMRDQELVRLNPLVSRLMSLRERAATLTIEKDEKGEIKKESIDEYKSVKADQRSYNGDLGREMKAMKKPYATVTSGLVAIEKILKDVSNTEVKGKAEEIFEEYEKEQERKKQEAKAKKEAEMNKAVTEANERAKKMEEMAERATVYNTIKFDRINKMLTDTMENTTRLNKASLLEFQEEISNKTFEDILRGTRHEILTEESIAELKDTFEKDSHKCLLMIKNRLAFMEQEEQIRMQQQSVPASIPPPPAPPVGDGMFHNWPNNDDPDPTNPDVPTGYTGSTSFHDIDFKAPEWLNDLDNDKYVNDITKLVESLERNLDERMAQGVTPQLAELKQKFLKFNEE